MFQVAEKFRKVMEAYQIENEYGSTSEQYTQTFTLRRCETRSFNMLRIGRIGLYFQSDDAKVTGRWDNDARNWVLDDSARNEVRKGLQYGTPVDRTGIDQLFRFLLRRHHK